MKILYLRFPRQGGVPPFPILIKIRAESSKNIFIPFIIFFGQDKKWLRGRFFAIIKLTKTRNVMDLELLQKLKDWRYDIAQKEDVALFRVLSNKTIEDIVALKPKTREDLITINGIKDKKFEKYGISILSLVNNSDGLKPEVENKKNAENQKAYSVSSYLNSINIELGKHRARVMGEISSLDIRGTYLFFSIKDKKDESMLKCFMWQNNYDLCGVSIEEGMEVIVDGFPEIYKPSGSMSFKASTVELVGEGELKRAYEALKKKLTEEGLFAYEKKRPIPEFSKTIGLITSETGAVIHDFLNNLGKYGYRIKFMNSRVEGQIAVQNLLSAVDYFNDKDIDVLVIIRGGGSLESLLAFNNETLARRISSFKVPVICGIGHDKDVPLVSLSADKAVSTPTAVAVLLNKSWDLAINDIAIFEKDIIYYYEKFLEETKYYLETLSNKLEKQFSAIFEKFKEMRDGLKNALTSIGYVIKDNKKSIDVFSDSILYNFKQCFKQSNDTLNDIEKRLKIFNPIRQLKLGYSIVSFNEKIVKSIKQVSKDRELEIQVSDGKIKSRVEDIIN